MKKKFLNVPMAVMEDGLILPVFPRSQPESWEEKASLDSHLVREETHKGSVLAFVLVISRTTDQFPVLSGFQFGCFNCIYLLNIIILKLDKLNNCQKLQCLIKAMHANL